MRTLLREKSLHAGGHARRQHRRRALPRRSDAATQARQRADRQLPRRAVDAAPDGADFKLTGALKPAALLKAQDAGDQAEHDDAGQPRRRPRHLRAGDPAAGRRPHRRRAARHPGHRQGAGPDRPHGDARDAHGRRERRGERRDGRHRPGAVRRRQRYLDRDGGPTSSSRSEVVVSGDDLTDAQPGFDSQTQAADRQPDGRTPRARASCATSRARTSASAWPSCCSRRARARSSRRRRSRASWASASRSPACTAPPRPTTLALLLRSGALAAPMEFIEETRHRPEPGRRQHRQGPAQRDLRLRRDRSCSCARTTCCSA